MHANTILSENKATCSSLSAEYDQIFGQPENEPKFGMETTVSQAWCSTITAATSADKDEGYHAMYRATAAFCRPVTKHLVKQTFVWYWLVFVCVY